MGKQLPDDLNTLKVTELKEALKERSLTVSGNKAELVARLQDFLNKQAPKEGATSDTPQKQAPVESESEPQNGSKDEEKVKAQDAEEEAQKEKEREQKENERRAKEEKEKREKEEKEKELREKERREKERKEQELKEKERKEKEQKEKERKEKEQKEKDQKEKAQREKEQKERDREEEHKTEKETDKSTESSKDEDKESQEGKKRKNTDDDKESTDSTTTPTKSSATSPSSTPSSTNSKRARTTWANNKTQSQSINISTDILKEMLPTPTSPKEGEDAEMANDTTGEDAGNARGRPAQQVYSAPIRREKKEEEAGPREVPQSRKPASNTLFIDRFVRPFTISQVKQLLEKTGEIEYFWMNQVKSQAYASFKTIEQATATRDAIYDLLWPPGNGSKLRAEFATEDEAKRVAEQHDLKRSTPTTSTTPTTAPFAKSDRDSKQDLRDSRDLRDPRDSLRNDSAREARNLRDSREALRDSRGTRAPPPPPKKTLEDLFHKTVALPSIYWLGLTAEQIAAKKSTSANDR